MSRTSGFPLLLRALPLAAATLLVGCTPSAGNLEEDVADKPGVIRVSVVEVEGNDGFPFAKIPLEVSVEMDGDASSEQVMAVFDEYDDDIDDGNVVFVEVILSGPKDATLSSGQDVQVTREAVDDLVDAQGDDDVVRYRREAYPVLPSVEIGLARGDFAAVVAVADRYRDVDDLESVTVVSGEFLLIRDEVNADLRITSAGERLTLRVASGFRLDGATVTGRGPLELSVARADVAAVRRFVAGDPDADAARRVVVRGVS